MNSWLVGFDVLPSFFFFLYQKYTNLKPPSISGVSSALQQMHLICSYQHYFLFKVVSQRCFRCTHTYIFKHWHTCSPCTPLRGQGPAPAPPGVKEDPGDALLMTCQKERAPHAPAYFTYSHVKAGLSYIFVHVKRARLLPLPFAGERRGTAEWMKVEIPRNLAKMRGGCGVGASHVINIIRVV